MQTLEIFNPSVLQSADLGTACTDLHRVLDLDLICQMPPLPPVLPGLVLHDGYLEVQCSGENRGDDRWANESKIQTKLFGTTFARLIDLDIWKPRSGLD